MMIGYYSDDAAYKFGTAIYLNDKSQEVHVTEVVDSKNLPLSKFKDLKQVGIVTKYLRTTRGEYL